MKPLYLTLSAGRSGTNKLATLLSLVPTVYAEHEGSPGFCTMREKNIIDPNQGLEFVQSRVEHWDSLPYDHIANTGHMTGEGFLEHFLALDIVPNIITLRRNPREVALSMFRLNWIPYRNKIITPWYAGPNEPGVLPYTGWQKAHSYQLCYWWVCDSERRIQKYTPILKDRGSKIWETTLQQIIERSHFNKMLNYFDLPTVASIPQDKVNHYEYLREGSPWPEAIVPPQEFLHTLEQEVLDNIPQDFRLQLEDIWKDL